MRETILGPLVWGSCCTCHRKILVSLETFDAQERGEDTDTFCETCGREHYGALLTNYGRSVDHWHHPAAHPGRPFPSIVDHDRLLPGWPQRTTTVYRRRLAARTQPVHGVLDGWESAVPRSLMQVYGAARRAGWAGVMANHASRHWWANGRQGRLYRYATLALRRDPERALMTWRSDWLRKGDDEWKYFDGLWWCPTAIRKVTRTELMKIVRSKNGVQN